MPRCLCYYGVGRGVSLLGFRLLRINTEDFWVPADQDLASRGGERKSRSSEEWAPHPFFFHTPEIGFLFP
jgi:hypothetical protein